MADKTWRILIIEDKPDLAEDARREIAEAFESDDDIDVDVAVETDFDAGYTQVGRGDCDIVVLDVRRDTPAIPSTEDETAGRRVFLDIKEARFAPVIFWTALPDKVADQVMSPLVSVVTKDHTEELPAAIRAAIESQATELIGDIELHVTEVLRKHMWSELGPHWGEYTDGGDPATIAQVLVSRLAKVLEADREQLLTARPSHRYVYPPASATRAPGDVLREGAGWWVVLTPACDIEQKKVEYVLLAHAGPLAEHPKYKDWATATAGSNESNKWGDLRQRVLTATQGRFCYLPAFRDIPDLVIDLENVRSVKKEELASLEAVASLVSPFSEALLVQHSHFRGRIGVPDLDADLIKRRLMATPPSTP